VIDGWKINERVIAAKDAGNSEKELASS